MTKPKSTESDAKPPRRIDRRRLRTRAALLSAGRTLYANRNLDSVSVDEIVAVAEVAKGSFYNHFADKDVFARQIAAGVRRQAEQEIDQANAGLRDPALRLARALCIFVRFGIQHPDSARVLWKLNSGATMVDAPINRDLRKVVEDGIRVKTFREVDLETGVLLVMGIIIIALRHALEERLTTALRDIGAEMAAGLLRALGVSHAQATQFSRDAANSILA